MSRITNSIRNTFWGYFSKLLNLVFPFILRTVIIRQLSIEYLGMNSLFSFILQVLSLSELGFGTAIVYSMYKPIAEGNKKDICALLNLYKKVYRVIGCIVLLVGLLITPFLKYLIVDTYSADLNIYIIYLMFLLNTVSSYFIYAYSASLLNAFQRNDLESKCNSIISILQYGIQIIILLTIRNYYIYLSLMLIFTIFNNLLKYKVSKKYFSEYYCDGIVEDEKKKEIKKNVFALACHKFGGTIINSGDNIVISAFLGITLVAQYSNYYYLLTSIESLILIFFTAITSILGNSLIVESKKTNSVNFRRILFLNLWMTSVCSVVLFCVYQDFILIWVGSDYLFSEGIKILFVLYFYCHMARRTVIVFRDASGLWYDNRWQPIVSGSFNLIWNIILIQMIGIYGVLLSTILSMILIDIPWEAKTICGNTVEILFKEYVKILATNLILTAIISMTAGYICKFIVCSGALKILTKTIIALLVGNSVLILFFRKHTLLNYYMNIAMRIVKHLSI